MGFYGKIYNQIGEFIKGFRFGNNNKSGADVLDDKYVPEGSQSFNAVARIQGDEATICTGNRWLQMTPYKFDSKTKTYVNDERENYCEIWHAPAGGVNLTKYSPVIAEDFSFGSSFTVQSLKLDETGHVLPKFETKVYTMPVPPNVDDIKQLQEEVSNLNEIVIDGELSERLENMESYEEIINTLNGCVLEPYYLNGIRTDSIKSRVENDLPAAQADIMSLESLTQEHNNKMTALDEKVDTLQNTVNPFDSRITDLEDFQLTIGDFKDTGKRDLVSFVGSTSNFLEVSLTDSIGDIKKIQSDEEGAEFISVIDSILALDKKVDNQVSNLTGRISTLEENASLYKTAFLGAKKDFLEGEDYSIATLVANSISVYQNYTLIQSLENRIKELEALVNNE